MNRVLGSLQSLPLICLQALSSFLTAPLSRLPAVPSIFPKQHFGVTDSASGVSLRVDSDWLSRWASFAPRAQQPKQVLSSAAVA